MAKRKRAVKKSVKRGRGAIPAKLVPNGRGGYKVMVAKKHATRMKNPTVWGTSHFVSRSAAMRYYKDYGYDDVKSAVDSKIRDGEIHIGKPSLKAGQSLKLIDGGKRYAILEK